MADIRENAFKLQKVVPVRIFEQAVEQIRELIVNGDISPGQKLPTEQELCRQLNTSRSSVREALRVLEAEGLIEVKRGSGAFVSDPPKIKQSRNEIMQWLSAHEQTLEQVLEVRESIEGLTAALAAQRATETTLTEIRAILDEQKRLIQQISESQDENYDALANLDAAFHLAISSASGNDIANEIVSQIVPAFTQSNKVVLYVSQRMHKTEMEHLAIYQALVSKDPASAEKAMREHIGRVRKEIIDIYQTIER